MTLTAPEMRTVLPTRDDDTPPALPRTDLGRLPAEDRLTIWGARFAGLALAWVICERLLPLAGFAWFLVMFAAMNVLVLALATWLKHGWTVVADRIASWLINTAALIVIVALVSTIAYVISRGFKPMMHLNFWTQSMKGVAPTDPLTSGGILHAILGSCIEVGLALLVVVPLGIGTAIYMTEIGGRFAKVVRTVVEAMTALPSVVAGLFIYTVWILTLGGNKSGLAAALALGVMALPIIARAADVVLRVVPGTLREASYGLGASRWKTVWHVVLPTARPGLATALILGIARAIGETSPVLLTSGLANFYVFNPTQGVMNSLPLQIYTQVRSGEPVAIARGFATAAALMLIVLALFVLARVAARPKSAKPGLIKRLVRSLPHRPVKES